MAAIMTAAGTAVTSLSTSVFNVVTAVFNNEHMLALVGLGIGFSVLAWGISLIPRYR